MPTIPLRSRFAACLALISGLAMVFVTGLSADPSDIYGENGEKWDSAGGPLPDFSFAGYQRGEKPLPDPKPEVSVKDSGAAGDGTTDDTAAIQKAIDENPGKVIHFPAGRYLLSDVVEIRGSGTVILGDGPDKTIFQVTEPLQKIHPLPVQYSDTGGTAYAYSGGFLRAVGSTGYFSSESFAVSEPAQRGDTTIQLAAGHPFQAGDEVVIVVSDTPEHTLFRYLYRDDPDDISRLGDGTEIRHVTRITKVDGAAVTFDRPLRTDIRPEWQPVARKFEPRLSEIGIADLAFEFPDQPYLGHFTEEGYNAIELIGVAHSWVRNVRVKNSDSGVSIGGSVFCTLTGILIESERDPDPTLDSHGHHAISMTAMDCLCTDFDIQARFIHDLTVSGGSVGSVFSNGKGLDLTLDHHKRAPYENLFSNLDLGEGSRIFRSGGSQSIGRHAAAGNTYWNLVSKDYVEVPEGFAPARLNLIGLKMRGRGAGQDPEGRWIETIRPGSLVPPDLHAAQLQKRLGKTPDSGAQPSPAPASGPAPMQSWTNTEGITIQAGFGGVKGDAVILILPNGKSVSVPLANLAPESRDQAQKLSAP